MKTMTLFSAGLSLLFAALQVQANPLDIMLSDPSPQPVYLGLDATLAISVSADPGAGTISGASAALTGGAGATATPLFFDLVSDDCPGTMTVVTTPFRQIEWTDLPDVGPGTPINCSVALRSRSNQAGSNFVSLRFDCPTCTGSADDRDSATITTAEAGDLAVELTFQESVAIGSLTGELVYRNEGTARLQNLALSIFGDPAFFANMQTVGNTPGCNQNLVIEADSISWIKPDLDPGVEIRCRLETSLAAPGSYSISALGSATTLEGLPDPWPDNNAVGLTIAATEFVVDVAFPFNPDANPGDGICADSFGNCSLRTAVDETNALPGVQTIVVPYRAGGYFLSSLPGYLTITDSVILSGIPDPDSGTLPWITRGGINDFGLIRVNVPPLSPPSVIKNLDLRGNPDRQLTVDGAVVLHSRGRLTIEDAKISGGSTSGDGGGLRGTTGLVMRRVEITENSADLGGGVYLSGSNNGLVDATLSEVGIHDNTADSSGGGLFTLLARTNVDRSAIVSNTAIRGGGIFLSSNSRITTSNTTISSNEAALQGGGVYLFDGSVTSLFEFTTIAFNVAGPGDTSVGDGGGLFAGGISAPDLFSSILFSNTARTTGGPFGTVVSGNCDGVFESRGFNTVAPLSLDPECNVFAPHPNDAYDLTPGLGPLTVLDHGIAYHPLTRVNNEIDQAWPVCQLEDGSANAFDQLGTPRPINGDGQGEALCDRGAVESVPVSLSLSNVFTATGLGQVQPDSGLAPCASPSCTYIGNPVGSTLTLTPVAEPGSIFTGWGGDCSMAGTGPCTLQMSEARSVEANFAPSGIEFGLTVQIDGEGMVTSQPTGIDCPSTCQFDFPEITLVTLIPEPSPGHEFSRWTGNCSGQGACVVEMDQARSVGAEFVEIEDSIFASRFQN